MAAGGVPRTDTSCAVGPMRVGERLTPARRAELVEEIAGLPEAPRGVLAGLGEEPLGRPCREGGWTVRQVVRVAQLRGLRERMGC